MPIPGVRQEPDSHTTGQNAPSAFPGRGALCPPPESTCRCQSGTSLPEGRLGPLSPNLQEMLRERSSKEHLPG